MHYNDIKFQKIYKAFPITFQNFLVSFYGLIQRRKRYGKYFKEYFSFLTESQYYDTDKLMYYQNKKLTEIIKWAYETVPFYQELFKKHKLKPSDIKSINDIWKIPILEKETLRKNWTLFISQKYPKHRSIITHTSGTTGKPITILISNNCFQREYAFRWLHYSWGGIFRGYKFATFAGHLVVPISQKKPPFWRYNYFENQLIFSSYHISNETLPYYIDALLNFQPKMIHGYPSSIYIIATYLLKHKIFDIRPKAIFCASETLLTHQRRVIEKAFGCKVFNWYGNTEMVSHIVECEYGNLHIQPFHSFTEILDSNGYPIKSNIEGFIVGTNFDNFAMPLIRYKVGDIAIMSKDTYRCSCGRSFPIINDLVGRVEDYVITPEGKFVGRLDHIFKSDVNVIEAQIIQEDIYTLKIKIVKDKSFTKDDEKVILNNLKQRIGENMKVVFEYVEQIPREPNGKFKFVVSHVKANELISKI